MATVRNLYVDQGARFQLPFTVSDASDTVLNLLGFTAMARLKRSYESLTYTDLSIDIVDAIAGSMLLTIEPTVSLGLRYGRYVYDVLIFDEFDVPTRVLEGIVTFNPAVTKITEGTLQ